MLSGDGDDHFFLKQRLDHETGHVFDGRADECYVDLSGMNQGKKLGRASFLQRNRNSRESLPESAYRFRYEAIKCSRARIPYRQSSLSTASHATRVLNGVVDELEYRAGAVEKVQSCICEFDPTGTPLEQRRADHLFERTKLLAQWRLLNSKPLSGSRHGAVLSDRDEIAEVPKLDR